jgi:hypothetical protein
MIAALIFTGCSETNPPELMTSIMTGPDIEEGAGDSDAINESVGRVGMKAGPLKFGYQGHVWEGDRPDTAHGLFVSQDLISDPNGLGLFGRPYIGGFVAFDNDDINDIMYGPYIGTEHNIRGIRFNTEFHIRTFDEALEVLESEHTDRYRVVFGPVFYFPLE